MGAEQVAFNVRVLAPGASHVPPGGRTPRGGHSHNTIEEIYFVIDGEVDVKLGDDVEHARPARRGPDRAVRRRARDPATRPAREAAFAMVSVKVADPIGRVQPARGLLAR